MAGHDNIPTLAEQVSRVPTQPGCYLWKDAKGDVIYVGKAKNLRARMRQYVTLQDERQKIPLMMQLVDAVEQLAQKMADSLSNSLTESLLKNDENQTADSDTLDVHQQTTLMATALKEALTPLTMRMDEKLAIDTSTDQSGKLIVNSLNRLNKIFDDYE